MSVIILTRDEEQNLVHALESLAPLDADITIVDSGSRDRTVEIARAHGCRVLERRWTHYADQFNWALHAVESRAPWCMRLDADERLTPELVDELELNAAYAARRRERLLVKTCHVHFLLGALDPSMAATIRPPAPAFRRAPAWPIARRAGWTST
ncbi:MAG: glycosyltransferase [Geminicoccaceae bacterium]